MGCFLMIYHLYYVMKFNWSTHNITKNKVDLPKDFLRVMNKLNKGNDHIIKDMAFYSFRLFDVNIGAKYYELNLYMKDEDAAYQSKHYYYDLFFKTCKVLQVDVHHHIDKIIFHKPK